MEKEERLKMERNNNNKSTSSLFGRMSARASFISKKEVKVTVQLLNDAETINNEFKKSATGKDVLDYVCEFLNITEKDYFGLRYQDHHRHRYWVDLTQTLSSIGKLFKSDNLAFRLRFRYYPSSAHQLREEITRYQLNVQLQRDLLHGRLYCPQPIAAQLGAYILQSQIGDAPFPSDGAKYVSEYKLLLKQTPKMEEKIAELHAALRGTSAANAELRMIEMASQLETYGFDPYTVKDPKNSAISVYIGATHRGILVFHNSQKAHHIQWSEVTKLDYSGNELRIYPCEGYEPMVELEDGPIGNGHLSTLNQTHTSESMVAGMNGTEMDKENEMEKTRSGSMGAGIKSLRYICPSRTFAKHLWVHLLSQKTFFNAPTSENIKPLFSKPRIPLLTRGSTFRFPAQRVLHEIETSPVEERAPVHFHRYELPKQTPRGEMPHMTKYQTLPAVKLNGHLRNGSIGEEKKERRMSTPKEEKKDELIRLMDDVTPSTSVTVSPNLSPIPSPPISPPTVISTVTLTPDGTQNKSVISVHLIKREESAAAADFRLQPPPAAARPSSRDASPSRRGLDTSAEGNNNWEKFLENPSATLGEPIAHSTPKAPELVKRGKFAENGNGNVKKVEEEKKKSTKQVAEKQSSSIASKFINLLFLSGLFFLIAVFIAIMLFERQESASIVEQNEWLSDVKRQYYEPIKEATLEKYNAVFSR